MHPRCARLKIPNANSMKLITITQRCVYLWTPHPFFSLTPNWLSLLLLLANEATESVQSRIKKKKTYQIVCRFNQIQWTIQRWMPPSEPWHFFRSKKLENERENSKIKWNVRSSCRWNVCCYFWIFSILFVFFFFLYPGKSSNSKWRENRHKFGRRRYQWQRHRQYLSTKKFETTEHRWSRKCTVDANAHGSNESNALHFEAASHATVAVRTPASFDAIDLFAWFARPHRSVAIDGPGETQNHQVRSVALNPFSI